MESTEVPEVPAASDKMSNQGYFDLRDDAYASSPSNSSMSIQMPPSHSPMDMAFTALQYLPVPLLVLSSSMTVVLANESMARILGIEQGLPVQNCFPGGLLNRMSPGTKSATDILYGGTLGSLGFDLLQDGNPVWISWEDFLTSVLEDASRSEMSRNRQPSAEDGEVTPRASYSEGHPAIHRNASPSTSRTIVHDIAVDVVFSTERDPETGLPSTSQHEKAAHGMTSLAEKNHVEATMIISVWYLEDAQYFTLSFTAASNSTPSRLQKGNRTVTKTGKNYASGMGSGSSSSSSGLRTHHSSNSASPASGPRLPNGPASKQSQGNTSSMLTKTSRMKDAILNAMPMPTYAMWKDESYGVPNSAALRLLGLESDGLGPAAFQDDQRGFLIQYALYTDNFERVLAIEEYPIMYLMKTEKAFQNRRVGMIDPDSKQRIIFDVDGRPIIDEKTGQFLGGVVVFRDVTEYANIINAQKAQSEKQFEDITNMIPNMIWTTDEKGHHDYYSQRWFDYTGRSPEECYGEGWAGSFKDEDLVLASKRWNHSLVTGDEYLTEYRCLSKEGQWRWMLGRALPMRDGNGKIVKWFGTCTDIHELVEAREAAKQTREQLLRVIEHAKITLWALDKNRRLSLFEGASIWKSKHTAGDDIKEIGRSVKDLFGDESVKAGRAFYEQPIEDILSGRSTDESTEIQLDSTKRWYRTRFVPLLKQQRSGGVEGETFVDGVVGVSMDVTELKRREEELRERDRENSRLHASSEAAKEASKMKSQFLANMSHEIRTPIAGVIGMAELLLDDTEGTLTADQRECAENLQRSANGLLTVINDILDFSKVESGRLDIEEVQFDLNVVVRDVNKMLSFAAERKGLLFIDKTQELQRLKVMGDPGRLRQILTNLLTNSIKFTSDGQIEMQVQILKDTEDKVVVQFTVQDTGIGIEEEVRKRLFQPFSQADSSTARRFGGTGLGLTISKNLVELMHGDISLESTLGAGTKATFWIPFNKAVYAAGESPLLDMGGIPDRFQSELSVSECNGPNTPASPERTMGRPLSDARADRNAIVSGSSINDLTREERERIHVLIVEDNPVNQQIAIKTIKKLGFSVNAVWNGQEALDYLTAPESESHPRPDIIFMDVQMPVMDGYKATSTIRNAQPFRSDLRIQRTPIVAMTASAIQGDREKCEKAGMNDYLSKPVRGKVLEKMLVKWSLERKKQGLGLQSRDVPTLRSEWSEDGISKVQPSFGDSLLPTQPSRTSSSSSMPFGTPQPEITPHNSSSSFPHPGALARKLTDLDFADETVLQKSTQTADTTARQHLRNEEKAMLLRDDQLLASGDDPKALLARGVSDDSMHSDTKTILSSSSPGGDKLTTANMKKLEAVVAAKGRSRTGSGLDSSGTLRGLSGQGGDQAAAGGRGKEQDTDSLHVVIGDGKSIRARDSNTDLLGSPFPAE